MGYDLDGAAGKETSLVAGGQKSKGYKYFCVFGSVYNLDFGKWDFRNWAQQSEENIERFLEYFEQGLRRFEKDAGTKNGTGVAEIIDFDGFSLSHHASQSGECFWKDLDPSNTSHALTDSKNLAKETISVYPLLIPESLCSHQDCNANVCRTAEIEPRRELWLYCEW